ncbi:MAG: holo-ACP synthase [Clostridiales bacterium]|nr:holo-ACP synthase [Clostridiales bacterium]
MVGIDIVSVSRIRESIENAAFVKRVFTAVEQNYCNKRPNSAESYAGIFCAKEAAVKALGVGFGTGIMPTDIVVTHAASGAPVLKFYRSAAELFKPYNSSVSISHDGDYAVAAVELTAKGETK